MTYVGSLGASGRVQAFGLHSDWGGHTKVYELLDTRHGKGTYCMVAAASIKAVGIGQSR